MHAICIHVHCSVYSACGVAVMCLPVNFCPILLERVSFCLMNSFLEVSSLADGEREGGRKGGREGGRRERQNNNYHVNKLVLSYHFLSQSVPLSHISSLTHSISPNKRNTSNIHMYTYSKNMLI